MSDTILTPKDAARILQVGASTIKRWADDGVLESFRTAGGHRRFPRASIEMMLARRTGGSPEQELAEAAGEGASSWLSLLTGDDDYLVVAGELLRARSRLGAWWAVARELGPVITEMGRRWASGELTVLQEHLASEKLSRALNFCSQGLPTASSAPVALLTMAYGDDHTLGLSMAELCSKEAGWRTRWAGRRTPLADIVQTLGDKRIDLLLLSASCASDDSEAMQRQYLTLATAAQAAAIPLVVGGSGAWPSPLPHGQRITDFEQFNRYLTGLIERPGSRTPLPAS